MSETIKKTKKYFLDTFHNADDPFYEHFPTHVNEVEKWATWLLKRNPDANKKIVMLSVWLHDIGHIISGGKGDHAIVSTNEASIFLEKIKLDKDIIKKVKHCIRAHRNKDVKPNTLEAKILVAADSASHFTDFCYIVLLSEGKFDYVKGKIERDYRDIKIFPTLKNKLTPLYKAWKEIFKAYPKQ